MRALIARWLRRFADWLDPLPSEPLSPYLDLAREVVGMAAALNHTGSFKRLVAMKALMARLPKVRKRDLAFAIELAVKELP